jgi:thymidylate synthase (FAD)
MKLIQSSVELIEQEYGNSPEEIVTNMLKHIELCARVAYKSEDKITDTSHMEFVQRMIRSGHTATLEQGTVYLYMPLNSNSFFYKYNPYSKIRVLPGDSGYVAVTTNYRVLVENNQLDDLQYVCAPTEYHVKRITAKFICDRGISHELVRHRVFSFVQESTRYCNYSKDKFGNQITYILPFNCDKRLLGTNYHYHKNEIGQCIYYTPNNEEVVRRAIIGSYEGSRLFDFYDISDRDTSFIESLLQTEVNYFDLLNEGWTPQQARAVLPNALKTEVNMTGTTEQWEEFIKLRTTRNAHPEMSILAESLEEQLTNKRLL